MLLTAGMTAAGGRAGIGATLVALVILGWTQARSRSRILRIVVVMALVAGTLATVIVAVPHARSQAERAGEALAGSDSSLGHRIIAWRIAGRVILAHPFAGVGPEGFGHAIWAAATPPEQAELLSEVLGFRPAPKSYAISDDVVVFRDPADGSLTSRVVTWDKAHSYVLDFALSSGLPALVLFVAFVFSSAIQLFRSPHPFARAVGTALVVAAVYGLAWFFTVNLDPFVWTLAGAGLAFARVRAASRSGTNDSYESACDGGASASRHVDAADLSLHHLLLR